MATRSSWTSAVAKRPRYSQDSLSASSNPLRGPTPIACLQLPEMIAAKLRACYQREHARDVYGLGGSPRVRSTKSWYAGSSCSRSGWHVTRSMLSCCSGSGTPFNGDDLAQLVHKARKINTATITADCVRGFQFLGRPEPRLSASPIGWAEGIAPRPRMPSTRSTSPEL